jgi:hypothetical protein
MINASNRVVMVINISALVIAIMTYFYLGGTITKRGQSIDPLMKSANLLASSLSIGIWASIILISGALTGKLGIKSSSDWLNKYSYPLLFFLMMIFYAIIAVICFTVYIIYK